MELRKQKEIEYYNKQAQKKQEAGDFEGFNLNLLNSYQSCCQWIEKNSQGKKILDYGCGNGVHSIFLAKNGAEVIGIDLSEPSLEVAKSKAKKQGVEDKIKFLKMDCEIMDFPDDFFDIIFDGGTFSSLDLNKALPELVRVLRPNGFLIGIETFGHNPVTNLKRKFNKLSGKRTEWAESHILKSKNLKEMEKYFSKVEVYFFHFISFLAFPFLKFSGGRILLKFLESIDKILLKLPFFKKYAFKIVFIFSKPKKI